MVAVDPQIKVEVRDNIQHTPPNLARQQMLDHRFPIGRVERRIELTGELTDEQLQRLLSTADRCPIKQTLSRGIAIAT